MSLDAEAVATAATTSASASASSETPAWTAVCRLDDILPDTGVCARVHSRHVAVFRMGDDQLFAIDNLDPKSQASVLSRGLVGNLGGRMVVASPLHKHHFDLRTGECLEMPGWSVQVHPVRLAQQQIQVQLAC